MIRSIFLALSAGLLSACGQTEHSNTAAPPVTNEIQVIPYHAVSDSLLRVSLPTDTAQSYALYIPHTADSAGIPPTIIVFADPHGAGWLPVEKYRKLADQFGIALAGSNNSRNGLDGAQCAAYLGNIVNDLHSRLHYEVANVCLAGFSGGAKVALQTASDNANINKVIYAGATIPFQPSHPVVLLGFAGTSDMNYSDLLTFAATLPAGTGTLVEFAGRHEWPERAVYKKAFYWLTFRQARDTAASQIAGLIRAYRADIAAEIAAATRANNAVDAHQRHQEAIDLLGHLTDVSSYQKKAADLSAAELYKRESAQKQDMLKSETNQKQILMQAFQHEDIPWWSNTISHLRASTYPTDQRLLGFISLGCYSYTSQCIARGDVANAEHFATIYELADPDNTDQLYFHAVIAAQRGDSTKALKYMQKAVDKGFTDWGKADAEPALATVRGRESFSRLQPSSKRGSR
ncbi:MAG: hypothetical protein JSS76_19400 [Bacteroidetes bacterium]|nr:hypothetical protein [Bacteroidota bacterium]